MKKWIEKFEKIFAAVSFAEAGCYDTALEMLGTSRNLGKKESLSIFLENVGLNNVRFCYVTAKV